MDGYCGGGYHDVWHTFTPAVTDDCLVDVQADGDADMIVTVLDSCGGNFVICGWGQATATLTQGVSYKIAVSSGSYGDTAQYTLTASEDPGLQ